MIWNGWKDETKLAGLNLTERGDFPGGPAVKTPHFHCRGHEFNP